jgi:hypothetical protein
MNARSRSEDDIRLVETGPLQEFADTGARRLYPAQPWRICSKIVRILAIEIEQDVRVLQQFRPSPVHLWCQIPRAAIVVRHVARLWKKIGFVHNRKPVRGKAAYPFHLLPIERRGDQDG